MGALLRVTTLVDWDSARRVTRVNDPAKVRDLEAVFVKLQDAVAQHLHSSDPKNHYRVNWRIYHGWHRGKTKTPDRRIFEQFVAAAGSRNIRQVSFGSDYAFGDSLCCASHRNPIYDTLRSDPQTGEARQKMVDTILVCDLLYLVRCKDSHLYIVIADDDDFVPALFVAEAWQGKVIMLHNRANTNAHLSLSGLASKMVLL